jgi:hypothetical protein
MVPAVKDSPNPPCILVEKGEDSSHLVIAFTGFQGGLNVNAFDFLSATGLLSSSRILLRDPLNLLYLKGCGAEAPSFHALMERLRNEIRELEPERVTCVGTSGGGFAALLFGHYLAVDQVHAFAPSTQASIMVAAIRRDWQQLRFGARPAYLLHELTTPSMWKYRNIERILRHWNGRTNYKVHVCEQSFPDMKRAARLRGLPHVDVAAYPCRTHMVVKYLIGERKLLDVIRG